MLNLAFYFSGICEYSLTIILFMEFSILQRERADPYKFINLRKFINLYQSSKFISRT